GSSSPDSDIPWRPAGNEDHQLRPRPSPLTPVLPDVVASRARPLGPREAALPGPEGPDLVGMEPRPARLLVPADFSRIGKRSGGASPPRLRRASALQAGAHERAAFVAVKLLASRLDVAVLHLVLLAVEAVVHRLVRLQAFV